VRRRDFKVCRIVSPLDFPGAELQNPAMALEFTTSYIKDATDVFRYYKRLADRAMEQAPEVALFATLDAESNSIAIIVKHLAGNMRSRWTDFLASDGEKPDRHRDTEFESPPLTRAELSAMWEASWKILLDSLATVTDADLTRTITIRGEAHSVMQAINRNITHTAYHVGQIVYLSKHFAGTKWTALTIPRGKSGQFNANVSSGKISQR
jgi:Protein of unknown function (DUF1572)